MADDVTEKTGDVTGAADAAGADKAGAEAAASLAVAAAADDKADKGKGGDDTSAQPTWPADWREKFAGEDKKALERLKRFNAPDDVYKSWRAADQRINSDEFIQKLPEDASEEQVKAYREKLGVPEKPEGYLDKLSGGLNIGDDDKPIIASFMESAHAKNWPPEQVDMAMQWYYGEMDQRKADLGDHDKEFRASSEDDLRSKWGDEYRPNLNMMNSFLDTAPEGVKDTILNGRGADGNLLGDNPVVLGWMVGLAKEANPAGIVVPGEGSSAKSTDDRLAEIAKYRRSDRTKYSKDETVLAEERRLLDAREKMKARA